MNATPMPALAPAKSLRHADESRKATSAEEAESEAGGLAALAKRERLFNFMMERRAEDQREAESLDTLILAQLKHQDEILKAWLRLA